MRVYMHMHTYQLAPLAAIGIHILLLQLHLAVAPLEMKMHASYSFCPPTTEATETAPSNHNKFGALERKIACCQFQHGASAEFLARIFRIARTAGFLIHSDHYSMTAPDFPR